MLYKLKDNFINETKDGSKLNYNRKIEIFIEYLQDECGVNNQNYKETLRGIGIDKIVKSIAYYVHNYGIQYTSTADNYITAIKSFFLFIYKNDDIYNEVFDKQVEKEKLDKEIEKKYKELELNHAKLKEPLSENEFNNLLEVCNDCIGKYDVANYENEGIKKTNTGYFLSSIMIKLAMYTGIKNEVFPTILKGDYDYNLNKIIINGIAIYLPDKLAMDFKKYYKIREELLKYKNKEDCEQFQFFINQNCDYIEKPRSGEIYKLMSKVLNTTEGERLCKYSIMNQIDAGIDVLDIMELTRLSIDTCIHCKELLNIRIDSRKNDKINSKLRNSKLYEVI